VPWQGKLVLGTTDTLRQKPKLEPEALEREIDFVLETAGNYLVRKPTRADVLAVFAGLRPLARPKEGSTKTKEISRSHKLIVSESGLVTLTGGKWTTFRKMGEDTVNYFTQITGQKLEKTSSAALKIHGYTLSMIPGHWSMYGADAKAIQQLKLENPKWSAYIHPKYPYTEAEVIWAVREEMAMKIEDVLSRRIRILILDARAAIEAAPKVVALMALELGKNEKWIEKQLNDFQNLAQKYLIKQ
jgi:glycerol-3-phosphate dehydrogenase